jgi:hypothetical protein
MRFKVIETGNSANTKKMKDIRKLLEKHYGEGWETDSSLQFYFTAISASQSEKYGNKKEENLCHLKKWLCDVVHNYQKKLNFKNEK